MHLILRTKSHFRYRNLIWHVVWWKPEKTRAIHICRSQEVPYTHQTKTYGVVLTGLLMMNGTTEFSTPTTPCGKHIRIGLLQSRGCSVYIYRKFMNRTFQRLRE